LVFLKAHVHKLCAVQQTRVIQVTFDAASVKQGTKARAFAEAKMGLEEVTNPVLVTAVWTGPTRPDRL
jgi:hypothetical protein